MFSPPVWMSLRIPPFEIKIITLLSSPRRDSLLALHIALLPWQILEKTPQLLLFSLREVAHVDG